MDADTRISPRRAANVRTATILLAIAAVFFCGIIAAQYSDEPQVAIGVLSLAIVGFLAVSIGRNVGRRGRR
jgi:VIT1/CCC1 family predicted Fe2+/Mn2+ transporter